MPRNARSPRANHRPANFTCHDHLTIARCQSHQPRARRHSVLSKLFFFSSAPSPQCSKAARSMLDLGVLAAWSCPKRLFIHVQRNAAAVPDPDLLVCCTFQCPQRYPGTLHLR